MLQFRDEQRFQQLRNAWEATVAALDSPAEDFRDAAGEVIDLLCEAAGMEREQDEDRELGMMHGYMVCAPGLGIRLPQRFAIVVCRVTESTECSI